MCTYQYSLVVHVCSTASRAVVALLRQLCAIATFNNRCVVSAVGSA
jgi:hypothetical protein